VSRTIKQIQDSIINEKALHTELTSLNSPSQTAIWRLWTYITAVAIYVHETLWDKFKVELEAIVDTAQIGTEGWVQQKAFEFQYDSTNPQIVTLVDFVPTYKPIDDTKKIITRCSVKTLPSKIVSIKVAKSDPPVPLDSTELNSFTGYLDEISFAGVAYNAASLDSDKLFVDAEIYYNGQYATVISGSVITAINTYLSRIPFDGIIRLSALEDAIQSVAGVTDVVLNNVALRADSTAFASSTYLVSSNTTVFNKYGLVSGYVIPETTSGSTLSDSLTFITE
jgi:hypothetical protein